MILNFVLTVIINLIQTIFGVLPNIPPTPQAVIDGGQWVIDTVASVIGILQLVYSPALLTVIIGVILVILNFDTVYHTAMWILRKIPMINVS